MFRIFLFREVQSSLKKTKAWNTGQLTGLDRNQLQLDDELEVNYTLNKRDSMKKKIL